MRDVYGNVSRSVQEGLTAALEARLACVAVPPACPHTAAVSVDVLDILFPDVLIVDDP
jgi:hypothetical protein